MGDLRLKSRTVTDDDGLRLRSSHFPFHLDRRTPPRSAGYTTRPTPVDSKLGMTKTIASNMSGREIPTTFMMVDYQQDRKQISAKLLMDSIKAQQRSLHLPSSIANRDGNRTRDSPSKRRSPGRPPQPLRSSFILQSRPPGDQDLNPVIMFNKEDKALQYEAPLARQDLNIAGYQTWSTKTVEPFFKELRKAVKAQRPADLEEYVIAYCMAKLRNQPIPETVGDASSGSPGRVALGDDDKSV